MTRTDVRRLLAAGCLLAGAALATATVVVCAGADRLSELADVVVDGTVTKRSVEAETTRGAIWTTYELDVAETWLGAERDAVLVHVPGGSAGGLVQEVAGTAQLEVGDRAVLFLTREAERLQVLGQAQGCFRVVAAEDGQTLICQNDLEGLALVDDDGQQVEARPTTLRHAVLERRVTRVARRREDAERRRKEERERKLAELRERAERNAERTRGKPGGAK